ncbi:MAG: diaminopimelate epimerase [Verrucomicrobiota bacterium]
MIHFWKMNGAGNDFVVIDNRALKLQLSREQIAALCHRQFGIGADGLLAVEPAQNGADFRMRYYNADGGEAEMCGNGARCFARFVNHLSNHSLEQVSFETMAGTIQADFVEDYNVRVTLSEPFDLSFNESLDAAGQSFEIHSVNTGVPHAVVIVDDLESVEINKLGAAIRNHDRFAPEGTNVNFVQVVGPEEIAVRTYERGVEGETLACGTGMVACAIIHEELTENPPPITLRVHSGDRLQVNFEHPSDLSYHNVTLTGPAEFVFEGDIDESTLAP